VRSYDENLSAAESQIRDTDMAAEMVKYTASNILQQATQANQGAQGYCNFFNDEIGNQNELK
jgi:hypothetical protein